MNPITHALLSWCVANVPRETARRDRVLATLGGVIPDLDGLGLVPDVLTRAFSEEPTRFFHAWHHVLGHNVGFALVATAGAWALARPGARGLTAALVALNFHLHLLCDIAGARGPDGNQWPIPYLLPLSRAVELTWRGQWRLDAWPNFAITGVLLAVTAALAVTRGRSIVEVVSARGDAAVVATLRRRFGAC